MVEVRVARAFVRWFEGLRDRHARMRIQARIDKLALSKFGDVKSVGQGVSELRIDYGRSTGSISYDAAGSSRSFSAAATAQAKRRHCRRTEDGKGGFLMPLETTKWDSAEYLKSREDIAAYLEAVFEDGDPSLIAYALGQVARAEGMTQIAKEAGLSRESLYRSLSADGNPEMATVLKVLSALGLRLAVEPIVSGEKAPSLSSA